MKKLLTLPLIALALLSGCLEQRYEREAKKVSGEWEILRYHTLSIRNDTLSDPEIDWRNAGRLSLVLCESPSNGSCSASYEAPDGRIWDGSYQANPPRGKDSDAQLQLLIQTDSIFYLTGSFTYAFDGDTLFLHQETSTYSPSGQLGTTTTTELDLLRIE